MAKGDFLTVSMAIWLVWMLNVAVLQISYNNNIITDTMLGNWTFNNLLIFTHYIWITIYFSYVIFRFATSKSRFRI